MYVQKLLVYFFTMHNGNHTTGIGAQGQTKLLAQDAVILEKICRLLLRQGVDRIM